MGPKNKTFLAYLVSTLQADKCDTHGVLIAQCLLVVWYSFNEITFLADPGIGHMLVLTIQLRGYKIKRLISTVNRIY